MLGAFRLRRREAFQSGMVAGEPEGNSGFRFGERQPYARKAAEVTLRMHTITISMTERFANDSMKISSMSRLLRGAVLLGILSVLNIFWSVGMVWA
jgi:hypothetical protein